MLELDHAYCIVTDPADAARRLEDEGWSLDAGRVHPGQGTRNRRLVWPEQYFELLWLVDAEEARANPLRLDRRGDWTSTGASPIGVAFRGQLDPAHADDFWLYDALGPRIWIHRDNERFPERPMVLVFEADEEQMQKRRLQLATAEHRQPAELRQLRIRGPSAPFLPAFAGRPIDYEPGAHLLELVVGDADSALQISDALVIRG